jgi:sulfite reductase (NADPH) flavoprotein alpha-component
MSLFATLLAQDLPTLHVYDGMRTGRDTTRVIDILDKSGLGAAYQSVLKAITNEDRKHLSLEGKALKTLRALNEELGTDYKPFEYHGHEQAEVVLVTFGSVESSLAAQTATALAQSGSRVGAINVRLYRPFAEEQFLKLVPTTARVVGVLSQVVDAQAVQEAGVHSQLYDDILASISYGTPMQNTPEVRELKYARAERWTPSSISSTFQSLLGKAANDQNVIATVLDESVQQYTFWNVDDALSASAAAYLAEALARDSAQNVTVNKTHDNLVHGGIHRIDVRKSPKTLDASYPITSASVAVVTDAKLLEKIDVTESVQQGGSIILLLPGVKDEEVEKKLPAAFRKAVAEKGIALYLINPGNSAFSVYSPETEGLILQTAFLRVALRKSEEVGLQKLATTNSDIDTLEQVAADLEKTLRQIEVPKEWSELEIEDTKEALPSQISSNSFAPFDKTEEEPPSVLRSWQKAAKGFLFKEAYNVSSSLRPDLPTKTFTVHVKENRRLTPLTYDRNIFHIEFDLGDSGLKYDIGEALGIHAENDHDHVVDFIKWYGLNAEDVVEVASRDDPAVFENRTIYQALMQNVDIFGRPPKKFYEALAEFADDENEKKNLLTLAGPEGFKEFQRRAEVDTVTYADVLLEFPSAHPSFHDVVRIVSPMKRREYSIASCQAVTPKSVALMIVVVNWVDPKGRDRFGQATKYLSALRVGAPVTVSVKPSVMKLPPKSTQPIIMAGLGTGLAPFRAFVQHRAMEKAQGKEIGSVLLYMGSRHQREEYCYGEEWEAYQAAGVITLLGRAFSRDQPQKIYIQDRMRQTLNDIVKAYIEEEGAFYLCGPTWPVPDVTNVLEEAITRHAQVGGAKKVDAAREIMKLKDEGRYVLEVY